MLSEIASARRASVLLLIAFVLVVGARPALAQSSDDVYWDDRFKTDSLTITAIATRGDSLYVSGDFTMVEGVPARHIALWNKRTKEWSALGRGLGHPATSLVIDGDDLYVAGQFGTAGGFEMGPIVRWSISTEGWFRLPELPDGAEVSAVVVDSTGLYAAIHPTGAPFPEPWRALVQLERGSPVWKMIDGKVDGARVRSLATMGSYLYVAGSFPDVDGIAGTRGFARWHRESGEWSSLGGGPSFPDTGGVNVVAVGGGQVYIGGSFASVGSHVTPNLARWDPAQEKWAGWGVDGVVNAIVVGPLNLYVGGRFRPIGNRGSYVCISIFNGYNNNAEFNAPVGGSRVDHIVMNDHDVYFAGEIWNLNGQPMQNLCRTGWNLLDGESVITDRGLGLPGGPVRLAVQIPSDDVLGVAGWSKGGLDRMGIWSNASHIALCDGRIWGGARDPGGDYIVTAVNAFISPRATWMVFGRRPLDERDSMSRLAFWNINHWEAIPIWGEVRGVAPLDTEIWCVGELRLGLHDTTRVTVASWDGTRWTVRKADGTINTVIADLHHLYIGGVMDDPEGGPGGGIARWDRGGNGWHSVGGGIGGVAPGTPANVTSLLPQGDTLYAAGTFMQEGTRDVACWAGGRWRGMGGGLLTGGTINAIASQGDVLYVGGTFDELANIDRGRPDSIGHVSAHNIARWDHRRQQWSALGSGVNDTVNAMAVVRGGLYAVGAFTKAGEKPSEHIALWHDPLPYASVPDAGGEATPWFALRSVPNPARSTVRIGFTLPVTSHVRLVVVTSDGGELATLIDAELAAGEHEVVWATGGVPSGRYFYRLRCGDRVESASVVVVH